jgi:putative oxidoreductase
MVQFMKNLSMMGAMLFIAANGSGPMSLDSWLKKRSAPAEKPALFAQAG